ncbi:MAG: hypothetical protein ABI340_09165 [Nitrososphaera sp.]|jgi:hypothetical protein
MVSRMIIIIFAGCFGGLFAISAAMMEGQAWEKPGTYSGISDASHPPTSTTDCYSFQTGCKNTNSGPTQAELDSGSYLSGDFKGK